MGWVEGWTPKLTTSCAVAGTANPTATASAMACEVRTIGMLLCFLNKLHWLMGTACPAFVPIPARIASRRKRVNSTTHARAACLNEPPRSFTPRDRNGGAFLPPRAVQRKYHLIEP